MVCVARAIELHKLLRKYRKFNSANNDATCCNLNTVNCEYVIRRQQSADNEYTASRQLSADPI